jgi:hypothetical protein
MTDLEPVNWLSVLVHSENKSRNVERGKGLQFSSIDGWSDDKLPKLLIVWNFEKESTEQFPSQSKEGKLTKPRDISARVVSYDAFLITKESESVVPWESTISHKELVKQHWTAEWIERLDEETRALNEKYSDRPIRFQTSFKNGKYLRLQYQVKNYTQLPRAPSDVMDILSPHLEKLLGIQFRLYKDHSSRNGPAGWYDNDMGRWENIHGKDAGVLHVNYGDGVWIEKLGFTEGRQDFWTGFAIDYLVSLEVPHFIDGGGHKTGMDHTLDFSGIESEETPPPDQQNDVASQRESFHFFRSLGSLSMRIRKVRRGKKS